MVPRHARQEQGHAAPIRNPGEDQPGSDKAGKGKETRMQENSKKNACQNEDPSGNANLPFQAYHFRFATLDPQSGSFPSQGAAFD